MNLDAFHDVSEILRCGVYALCAKGRVIYIGKSRRMLSRIYAHAKLFGDKKRGKVPWWLEASIPGIAFDEIHVRPCSPDALDALERDMIELYKPHYNVRLKTDAKAQAPVTLTIGALALNLNQRSEPFVRRL